MKSRFTKIGLAVAFSTFALTVLPTQSDGQRLNTDLSMRRALYFTGAKTTKIDTRAATQGGDPYVVANGNMTLKTSQATKCEADGCYFNFGFFITRTPASGALSTYGLIQIAGGGLVGNELQFANNVGSHQHVLPIKLAKGVHKLRITVDPYAKTPESDENNNSFTVTIVVRG
jgi:hypothetical protein